MKERPMLFAGAMVREILVDRKNQTRRIVKLPPQPDHRGGWEATTVGGPGCTTKRGEPVREEAAIWNRTTGMIIACPYGSVGDRIWVKETHQFAAMNHETIVVYRASCEDDAFDYVDASESTIERIKIHRWRPSIFMRRLESRIDLEILRVRVERLNDISEGDAKAEGVRPFFEVYENIGRDQRICSGELARDSPYRASFACLWDDINGDRALWSTNPWVWAIEFRRLRSGVEDADPRRKGAGSRTLPHGTPLIASST